VAAVLVGALAVAAAVWATVAAGVAFPYLGVNHDEAVYLLQAETLRGGRLFPPAPSDPEVARSMLPWLSAHRGDAYVPKYSPVWPALLAVAGQTTGSYHAAQALVAAGVVLVTYLLALELVRERAAALVAAAFVVLSPFFLLQSPTLLAYLPNVLLLATFAYLFARASRTDSRPLLGLAGVARGLAFFNRPFDALLFGAPFGLWMVASRLRTPGRLARDVAVLALGTIPGLLATLIFFKAATGNPLRSPFFVDEHDTIGFGPRRMLPEDPFLDYGPPEALQGVIGHSLLLSFWCFGGLVLVALGLVALRRRSSPLEPSLAAVALVVPAGYALFWGAYMVTQWEGPWRIGPYYYLPVLIPLVVLGAKGFVRFWRWDRLLAGLTCVGMLAISGFVAVRALEYQVRRTEEVRRLQAPLEAVPSDRAVVFLPSEHLLLPFTEARNASLDQRVLWAVDRGTSPNLRVLDSFPGRTPYLVEGGETPELRELAQLRGDRLGLRVLANPPAATPAVVELVWRGQGYTVPVPGSGELAVTLTAEGTEGMPTEASPDIRDITDELFVRLLVGGEEVAGGSMPIMVEGKSLHVLLPAAARTDAELLDVVAGGVAPNG
ncbi:MAG: glycosyltransferase family 39 protein, partial [Actinomycetota bacterium]|nr:glycosyltransferase family 39 protein [Actinomycetota bacterium]